MSEEENLFEYDYQEEEEHEERESIQIDPEISMPEIDLGPGNLPDLNSKKVFFLSIEIILLLYLLAGLAGLTPLF